MRHATRTLFAYGCDVAGLALAAVLLDGMDATASGVFLGAGVITAFDRSYGAGLALLRRAASSQSREEGEKALLGCVWLVLIAVGVATPIPATALAALVVTGLEIGGAGTFVLAVACIFAGHLVLAGPFVLRDVVRQMRGARHASPS
jgi:hypothetical protein